MAEERRIGEERRSALVERENEASAELSEALAQVEQRVSRRLTEWTADLERTEQSLAARLARCAAAAGELRPRRKSPTSALDPERLDTASEAQRERMAALSTEFDQSVREIGQRTQEDLEAHERDRRRALHEVADRLRHRERELTERVAAEEAEAIRRIEAGFADIERRQLDQLKRVVERTANTFSEAVSQQFDVVIKAPGRMRPSGSPASSTGR